MKRIILATLAIIALVLALGSVGAYASESIGAMQCSIQVAVAVIVEWVTLVCMNK